MLPDHHLKDEIDRCLMHDGVVINPYGCLHRKAVVRISRKWPRKDLQFLEECGIYTIRQLLNARPSWLDSAVDIPWERLAAYRMLARWSLHAWTGASRTLLEKRGWSTATVSRLSDGMAHALALGDDDDIFEIIVQMDDVLPVEEIEDLSRGARIERRRRHATETQARILREFDFPATTVVQIWLANQFGASVTAQQVRQIAEREEVRRISPALQAQTCVDEGIARISASGIRGKCRGSNRVVALIDTGVDDGHADFQPSRIVHKRNYIGDPCRDEHGHGTHLAGIIASGTGTFEGVAPDSTVWCYRALDENGAGNQKNLSQALQDAIQDAHTELGEDYFVINCSFAVPQGQFNNDDDLLSFCDAFGAAMTDAVVVTAAGNDGPEDQSVTAPGGASGVLTVGASANRPRAALDVVSWFSSRGPGLDGVRKPDVVAPGGFRLRRGDAHEGVSMVGPRLEGGTLDQDTSTEKPWCPPNDATHWGVSGTSQATAVVSGLCAILLEGTSGRWPAAKPSDIKRALKGTAQRLGYGDNEEGYGLVDGDAALAAL